MKRVWTENILNVCPIFCEIDFHMILRKELFQRYRCLETLELWNIQSLEFLDNWCSKNFYIHLKFTKQIHWKFKLIREYLVTRVTLHRYTSILTEIRSTRSKDSKIEPNERTIKCKIKFKRKFPRAWVESSKKYPMSRPVYTPSNRIHAWSREFPRSSFPEGMKQSQRVASWEEQGFQGDFFLLRREISDRRNAAPPTSNLNEN